MTRATSLRQATPDDAESIAAIVRGIGAEPAGLAPDFATAAHCRGWISRLGENGVVVVAYDGSIPVAFGAIDFNTMEPEIGTLGV